MRLRRTREEVFVGLDLSPGRIKLVGITAGPSGPALAFASDHALPAPDGGDRARFDAAAAGAEVAALLSRFRVRPRSVALALGPAEAVARRLVVVEQGRAQMLAALSLQLGQALGADVTAPRVDYAPLAAPAPPGRVAVFAAAARTEAVAAQQRAVAAAGCEQGPVTAAAAALVGAWRAFRPARAADGTTVLLHVGHTAALWIVLDGGEPAALDAPLVGLSAVRDRAGPRGGGAPADAAALPPAVLGEWVGRLRQEVARGLQSVRRESGRDDAGSCEVWVSGGGARVPGFLDALGAAMDAPVHAFDPLAELPSLGEPADAFGPALVPALGAALQALAAAGAGAGGSGLALDLRAPGEGSPAQDRIPLPVLLRSVARDRGYRGIAAATLVLWGATAFLGARVDDHERALAERETRLHADSAAVAATLARTQLLDARRRALGDRVDAVAALEGGRYAWPRLLHGISAAVPASAWVSDVLSDGEDPATGEVSFRLRGYAPSEGVAGAFARALVAGGAASEAEVVRTATVKIGRTPVVHFEMAGRAPVGEGKDAAAGDAGEAAQ